jgi:LysR family transcriptional regulator, transcriptional activator for bauABCD operon
MGKRQTPISFSPTDLRLLRVFRAVVRHKGFAAAQDELGLSPATISNHIARLEGRFGIRLCERGRKGFSLTPDGLRINEAAEALLRSVENFTGIVGSVKGELTGTVHLGIVDAMYTNRDAPLHKAIISFADKAPRVHLHIEIASPQELLQHLVDGRYGAVLTPSEAHHPSIRSVPLFREEQRLYCGVGHPLFLGRKRVSTEEIRQFPYVSRSYMLEAVQTHDEGFDHRATTSHMEVIAILIMSGRFLGYLPTHFAQSFVLSGEMRSLLDDELAYFDTFYLAARRDERNRATCTLMDCIRVLFSAEPS